MKKEWRPEGWENPYTGYEIVDTARLLVKLHDGRYLDRHLAVEMGATLEAGADAMLKAIREKLGKMDFLLE